LIIIIFFIKFRERITKLTRSPIINRSSSSCSSSGKIGEKERERERESKIKKRFKEEIYAQQ
jgi:hypothetical protein